MWRRGGGHRRKEIDEKNDDFEEIINDTFFVGFLIYKLIYFTF